ncbi:MAG: cysteine desulfurase family protein [Planctomycetota bacterium]
MRLPIYLDNNATTCTDPRVLEAMIPFFTEKYGNPASKTHSFGWQAEEAVEISREEIAHLIGGRAKEIIFTSGTTEANNLAILGAARMQEPKGRHIVSSPTEHRAVLDPLKELEKQGWEVGWLRPDRYGRVTARQVEEAIRPDTVLVSIMFANNEVGTLQPVGEIGEVTRRRGVLFHCDAAQAVGRVPVDVEAQGIDLLSFSAHKIYGPKGIGVLAVRQRPPRARISPLLHGGGHERGLRSGTVSVPLIVGLAACCNIAAQSMAAEAERCRALGRRLLEGIREALPEVVLNGHPEERLPGNLNLSFQGLEAEALLLGLPDIAISTGSACTSASLEPSHVLRAIGTPRDLAHSSVRLGIGRFNTEEEIEYTIERLRRVVERLRGSSARL